MTEAGLERVFIYGLTAEVTYERDPLIGCFLKVAGVRAFSREKLVRTFSILG